MNVNTDIAVEIYNSTLGNPEALLLEIEKLLDKIDILEDKLWDAQLNMPG